jgi:hypothetical protein
MMPVFRGLGNRILRKVTVAYAEVGLGFDGFTEGFLTKTIPLADFLRFYRSSDPRALAKEEVFYDLDDALAQIFSRPRDKGLPSEKIVNDIIKAVAEAELADVSDVASELISYLRPSSLYEPLNAIWTRHWNAAWHGFVFSEFEASMDACDGGEGILSGFNGWESDGEDPYAKDKGITLYFDYKMMIADMKENIGEIEGRGLWRWIRDKLPFRFSASDMSEDFDSYTRDTELISEIEKEMERFLGTDEPDDPNQLLLFPTENV